MNRHKIVLAVTIDDSLQFLKGYPEYLVERGWEVHVVSDAGPRLDRLSQVPHVFTHPIHMRRQPHPFHDIVSLWRWVVLMRQLRPLAVSVGTPKAGLLGSVSAKLLSVPVRIYMLRGLKLETSTGLRRQVLLAVERLTTMCATEVIAVSHSLMNRSLELKIAPERKVRVIGHGSSNGTDTTEFDSARFSTLQLSRLRTELGLLDGVPVVGYVGRLTRDKGLFVLADALEILAKDGKRVQVLIVGDIDDPSGGEGLKRLRSLGLPVVVTGHVAHPAEYYAVMDIFCLPSYREGFVNVVIEASSSGIPVAVSDATGVVDTVRDGQTGLVSPVGDPKALAENLVTLISDPEAASMFGASGRTWVLSRFRRGYVQKNYADHLELLCEGKTEKCAAGTTGSELSG